MILYTHSEDETYPPHDFAKGLERVLEVHRNRDHRGRWVLVAFGTKHTAQNFKRFAASQYIDVEVRTRPGKPQRKSGPVKSEIYSRAKNKSDD